MSEIIVVGRMPVLALRGMTVFPEQTVHFDIGRVKSALALEAAMKNDQTLFLAPQKHIEEDDPKLTGLYPIGCVAKVKQILKSQGENICVLVTGLYRAKITEMARKNHLELCLPKMAYCTDNAAMIASAGYYDYVAGIRDGLDMNAYPSLEM